MLFHYLLERRLACTQRIMEVWAAVGIQTAHAHDPRTTGRR
jgi:hypothetical protein